MQLNDLFLLLIMGAGGAYWWYASKNQEIAITEARRLCGIDGLQLLDHTVEQKKLGLSRNKFGSVCFLRQYTFEFTTTGEQRYQGRITISSGKILKSDLDAYRVYVEDIPDP
ncbi:MAG: DUF3301 domain-containing protein [Pseudomonadales bacterium]|nr:DUF3301 domain-containing protein [Pseudomonadales bacterium]